MQSEDDEDDLDKTVIQDTRGTEPVQKSSFVLSEESPTRRVSGPGMGIGSTVSSRYVIESKLGHGGMGAVYRAKDLLAEEAGDPNPYVAIKILNDLLRNHPKAMIALHREAKKAQDLAHPNITTAYSFDRDDGLAYITMEQLHGQSLQDHIKGLRGQMDRQLEQAHGIIRGICGGLSHAHHKGIVHSDLKPANVFITDDNDVKILDFGISKAVNSVDDNFDVREIAGLTPAYASLEMFDGVEPDPTDDIYALGVIAYELFAGHHPFQRQPATIASARDMKAERPDGLKNHEWRAISDALSFKRELRPADAAEFLRLYAGRSRQNVYLATALLVVSLMLAAAVVLRPDDPETAVPMEELPVATQEAVRNALAEGNRALSFRDYNGALLHFNEAYTLHPYDEDAMLGLEQIVQVVVDAAEAEDEAGRKMQYQQVLTLLQYDALSEREDLLELRQRLAPNADTSQD